MVMKGIVKYEATINSLLFFHVIIINFVLLLTMRNHGYNLKGRWFYRTAWIC